MATFTVALKDAIRYTGGSTEVVNGQTMLINGDIGLAFYPIFDEDYRDTLNGRIVDRYWNREIGMESIDMFKLAMRRKMNEIMPYYNKLYLSEKIDYEALSTVNLKTTSSANGTHNSDSTADSTAESNSKSNSRAVASTTPQTMLSGNGDYATSGNDAEANSDSTSNGTNTGSEKQTTSTSAENTTTGYQGAASDLIMRYRESLLNIDLMILSDLEELFMLVWNNGDTYTNNNLWGYVL